MILLKIPGTPCAKKAEYEQLIAVYASAAMKNAPLLEHSVRLHIGIYCKVPGRWSKKRRASALGGMERPSTISGIDHIIKTVADGMNGIVWIDDSQIVELVCSKHYALEPHVNVSVTSPEMEPAI